MKFRIGQCFIQVSMSKEAVIVMPLGSHVMALKISMYDMPDFNSIKAEVEVYNKADQNVARQVQAWMDSLEA